MKTKKKTISISIERIYNMFGAALYILTEIELVECYMSCHILKEQQQVKDKLLGIKIMLFDT